VTLSSNNIRLLWLVRNRPKNNFCVLNPFPEMEIYFPLRCYPNKSCANTTLTWMLSINVKLITREPGQITLAYCDWNEIGWKRSFWALISFPGKEICFPFRCYPNKSCANITLMWMLSNILKLVTWHPRQITLGFCDWSEISWKISFCAQIPFPIMESYFPFNCYPNNSCANKTLTWMLSNKLKMVTWRPRKITLSYSDWSEIGW